MEKEKALIKSGKSRFVINHASNGIPAIETAAMDTKFTLAQSKLRWCEKICFACPADVRYYLNGCFLR